MLRRCAAHRAKHSHPDRNKYITGRALGSSYEKEPLLVMISGQKSIITTRKTDPAELYPFKSPQLETVEQCRAVFYMHTQLRLVVNLQNCAKAQDSIAYANKVKLSNLKMMAETILFVQQNGFNSLSDVEKAYEDACQRFEQAPSIATQKTKTDLEIILKNTFTIMNGGRIKQKTPSREF